MKHASRFLVVAILAAGFMTVPSRPAAAIGGCTVVAGRPSPVSGNTLRGFGQISCNSTRTLLDMSVTIVGPWAYMIPGQPAPCSGCNELSDYAYATIVSCAASGVGFHSRAKGVAYQAVSNANQSGAAIDGSTTYQFACLEPQPEPEPDS